MNRVRKTTQQSMQTINNWKHAGLEECAIASSRKCDIEEQTASRPAECKGRVRSQRCSASALSLILCAAMVPSAFSTYSASPDIVSSQFRHSMESPVAGPSKLKKSVSFSCKMDKAVLENSRQTSAELKDAVESLNLYTPVHSSSDLERASGDRIQSMRLRGQECSPTRRRSLSSGDESAAPYIYTRLQTQLFPQMRF
jgi:hypothetical protein